EIARPDVPLLERAGSEVLDDHVGGPGQPAEHVLALRAPEVERDALAASPLHRPEQRVALATGGVHEPTELAHEVAPARLLDLDDLGAHPPQQTGAERPRAARPKAQASPPPERRGHATVRLSPSPAEGEKRIMTGSPAARRAPPPYRPSRGPGRRATRWR